MAKIPLTATDPDILASVTAYAAGGGAAFMTRLQANQTTLSGRDQEIVAALEMLAATIGFGAISGGAISAGTGLSVNIATLSAIVGTWVGFNATEVVAVNASVTNYIFLRQDWTWTVPAAGSSTPPLSSDGHGAALLWGTATCSGSAVTSVSNVRKSFLQQMSRIPLLTADPTDASTGDAWGRTDTTEFVVQGLGRFTISGGGGGNVSFKGTYDNATTYAINDLVISGGVGYIAIASTVGHTPPNVTYWTPIGSVGATGATGPAGPTGPAGAQGLSWQGAWSGATAYAAYDLVSYSGSSYIAIAAGTNKNPATETAYWNLVAAAGADGSAGAAGAAGAAGSVWYETSGDPGGGVGVNGDWAFDPATADVWKRSSGTWSNVGNIRGTQGSIGLQGPTSARSVLLTLCAGFTPAGTGADVVEVTVPYSPVDGTSILTFNVRRIDFRVNAAGGAPAITVQKSTVGNATFGSGTTVGTVTLGSGDYEGSNSSALGTVASGNKLRFSVGTLGTATGWTIEVLLSE